MTSAEKYREKAERWSDEAYADPVAYLHHRAELVVSLGPALEPGDTVLDLACGDGGLAEPMLALGVRYAGVDLSEEMVSAAKRRLVGRAEVHLGDLNTFTPGHPVAAATCFRAVYYAVDRRAFFRHVAGYTERKLVFDLNPRQYRLEDIRADLRTAGFPNLKLRPFFFPQTHSLPRRVTRFVAAAEGSGLLARALLRVRFTYICAAWR